jgi:hypothetical protein
MGHLQNPVQRMTLEKRDIVHAQPGTPMKQQSKETAGKHN